MDWLFEYIIILIRAFYITRKWIGSFRLKLPNLERLSQFSLILGINRASKQRNWVRCKLLCINLKRTLKRRFLVKKKYVCSGSTSQTTTTTSGNETLHGVDDVSECYKLFALILKSDGDRMYACVKVANDDSEKLWAYSLLMYIHDHRKHLYSQQYSTSSLQTGKQTDTFQRFLQSRRDRGFQAKRYRRTSFFRLPLWVVVLEFYSILLHWQFHFSPHTFVVIIPVNFIFRRIEI